MPSRKKTQGKARKDKRAAQRSRTSPFEFGAQGCRHREHEKDWSWDDVDAANKLANEYASNINALDFDDYESFSRDMARVPNEFYDEYHKFNHDGQELFRKLMISSGTATVLARAKQIDLSKESNFDVQGTWPFTHIIQTIEVRDRHGGAFDQKIWNEIHRLLDDIVPCPRETVRFFHKRNSCDCLKELYYKLKESTKRTSYCWHCENVVDIRKLSRCECEAAQYCTYKCALADWPSHKQDCKQWRQFQEKKANPKDCTADQRILFREEKRNLSNSQTFRKV